MPRMLAGMDDRMLADIGLTRSDLRDAYAEPLWRDPTDVLAGRARDKRIHRRGRRRRPDDRRTVDRAGRTADRDGGQTVTLALSLKDLGRPCPAGQAIRKSRVPSHAADQAPARPSPAGALLL